MLLVSFCLNTKTKQKIFILLVLEIKQLKANDLFALSTNDKSFEAGIKQMKTRESSLLSAKTK